MQLVFSAVQGAMSDPESLLSRAVHTALKVGVGKPAKWLFGGLPAPAEDEVAELLPREPAAEAPQGTRIDA